VVQGLRRPTPHTFTPIVAADYFTTIQLSFITGGIHKTLTLTHAKKKKKKKTYAWLQVQFPMRSFDFFQLT
jgi:hypothetical protein